MDSAVSPVIGVMLMLVVTIIIAAVVSSFAGGLVSGQQAAPSMGYGCEGRQYWFMGWEWFLCNHYRL